MVLKKTHPSIEEANSRLGGKYLTFLLGKEEYGVEILEVIEIVGIADITPVPCTPAHVMGVMNLRGEITPVIDLRIKLGMEPSHITEESCVIVVKGGSVKMGVMVDAVSDVMDIAAEDIQRTPDLGMSMDAESILGLVRSEDQVTILIDIKKILLQEETLDFEEKNY
jgi:purine-binding chemotaxis protein CheW